MTKKNRKSKKSNGVEIESAEVNAELTESSNTDAEREALPSDSNPAKEVTSGENPETSANADEESADELLDDVRRSLIEDEGQKDEKSSKWWRRKRGKKTPSQKEEPASNIEIDLPAVTASSVPLEEQTAKEGTEEYLDEIDELIDMLDTETEQELSETTVVPVEEVPPEPEKEIDIEELKKQAFTPRAPAEEDDSFSEVRTITLAGDEEVFVEVESKTADPLEERLSAIENALRPYRRYVYITLAVLGVVMAAIASLILYNIYQRSLPEPVKEVSNLPYPTSVALPGGWSCKLGKGTLQDGEWNPNGAEWLEGTEVCRWVALPWSLQLEAVMRTLNPKDPIELGMSNNDRLVYQVYSVRELTPEEMQELDSSSPCLLLVLTQSDSDKRWVLTALP